MPLVKSYSLQACLATQLISFAVPPTIRRREDINLSIEQSELDPVPRYGVYAASMLTIGKIAKESGVGIETVRFYERKGLIKQPKKRLGEGFRTYQENDSRTIRFIKRAQGLGFTLAEVKGLLQLNSNPKATCDDVRILAEAKLKEIKAKIKDLKQMHESLKEIESACDKSRRAIACCRIVDCFENGCC